jgi:hypothetical protein
VSPARLVVAAVAATIGFLATPAVVGADPAGPTDYISQVVAVTPVEALDTLDVRVVGGDAFVEAIVEPGHELIVLGYLPDEEPYLRIGRDGIVEQNIRSYATYYNESRYGTDDIPDVVDTTAAPAWERIGEGGSWAWHDHRAHWMGTQPLIGLDPGDSLPAESIPMLLDGQPVSVDVVTTYLPDPSPLPALLGALLGVQIGLIGIWLGRASTVLSTIVLAGLALTAGIAQFSSLPSSTGPLITWWLLPALALGCAVAVIAVYGRSIWVESGLLAIAAAQLVVWAWQRLDHTTAAYVPTDLPMWLDRLVTTTVLTGAAIVLVGTVWQLWRNVGASTNAARQSATHHP